VVSPERVAFVVSVYGRVYAVYGRTLVGLVSRERIFALQGDNLAILGHLPE